VINELVAQAGFRSIFILGVRKLIADQLNQWEEHTYGWWAVEARLSNSLKGGWGLQYKPLFNRSFNVRSCQSKFWVLE
jgi:hypothetical protein